MTRLWNDPADVRRRDDRRLRRGERALRAPRAPAGSSAARSCPTARSPSSIGGGSGHYPAFGGLVGQGLAHGAAMGNLFASPSTQQIHAVASAAQRGGGVFFTYGNYAGDVLNFDAAQERLRAEGIACETVAVTDDIFERLARREAQAPRHRGRPHGVPRRRRPRPRPATTSPGVTRVARLRERAHPLVRRRFHRLHAPRAPSSRCSRCPRAAWPSASASTANRASTRPASRPRTDSPSCSSRACSTRCPRASSSPGPRVVPILNGLGSLKYEEMFVVYRRVAELLRRSRRRDHRPARRRVLHELRHGRHLADPVLARRRTRRALGHPGRHPRLPARLRRRGGAGG